MSTIRLNGLSDIEAEDIIATVWRALERQEIPSPRVRVRFRSDGLMDIRLAFGAQEETEKLMRAFLYLAPDVVFDIVQNDEDQAADCRPPTLTERTGPGRPKLAAFGRTQK